MNLIHYELVCLTMRGHAAAVACALECGGGTSPQRRLRVEPLDRLDGFQDTAAGFFLPLNAQFDEKSPYLVIIDDAQGLLDTRGHGRGQTATVDPI